MTHHPTNDQLSAFLDGELDETEAASLEAALEADADLRAELEKLRGVQRLLRTHGPARAPEGFAQRVIAAAEAEGDNVVAGPWWRRPFGIPVEGVLVAAAAALVLIVALPRATETSERTAPAAAVEKKAETEKEGVADAEIDDDAVADAQGQADPTALGAKGTGQGGGGTVAPAPKEAPTKKAPETPATKELGTKGTTADQGVGEADPGSTDNAATPEGSPAVGSADPIDPVMASAGMTAQLYTDNEEILGQIQAAVSRYGGVIRDANGKVVKTGLLVDSETWLILDVPTDRVSELTKALAALDVSVETTDSNKLVAGGTMKLPLRVLLTGNAPSTGKPAPSAVRKSKTDTYEAAEDLIEEDL